MAPRSWRQSHMIRRPAPTFPFSVAVHSEILPAEAPARRGKGGEMGEMGTGAKRGHATFSEEIPATGISGHPIRPPPATAKFTQANEDGSILHSALCILHFLPPHPPLRSQHPLR